MKKIIHVFGNDYYLLGIDPDGIKYYLARPSFDCGWYWGGLYVETFSNNRVPEKSRDIESHLHFDSLFLQKYDCFNDFFVSTPLEESERYKLFELAKTFYTLRQYADLVYRGNSNIAKNSCYDLIKNEDRYKEVVEKLLPAVISEIINLLGGNTTSEEFSKQVKIWKTN